MYSGEYMINNAVHQCRTSQASKTKAASLKGTQESTTPATHLTLTYPARTCGAANEKKLRFARDSRISSMTKI